jgi:hypothetical protein
LADEDFGCRPGAVLRLTQDQSGHDKPRGLEQGSISTAIELSDWILHLRVCT